MKDSWLRLKDAISKVHSECGQTFNAPASEADIGKYENATRTELPHYLKEMYRAFNGQNRFGETRDSEGKIKSFGRNVCFLEAYRILPLEETQSHFNFMVTHLRNHGITEGEASDGQEYWSRRYFLLGEYNGDWLAVDMMSEHGKIVMIDASGLVILAEENFACMDAMPQLYIHKINKGEFEIDFGFMYLKA